MLRAVDEHLINFKQPKSSQMNIFFLDSPCERLFTCLPESSKILWTSFNKFTSNKFVLCNWVACYYTNTILKVNVCMLLAITLRSVIITVGQSRMLCACANLFKPCNHTTSFCVECVICVMLVQVENYKFVTWMIIYYIIQYN